MRGRSGTIPVVAALAVLAAAAAPTAAAAAPSGLGYTPVGYSDVGPSTPHARSIIELTALGIADGFSPAGGGGSTFAPDQPVTRAEFAKLMDNERGLGAAAGTPAATRFSDVSPSDWFAGYVAAAAAQGIVTGFPDGTFRPDAPVTYDQAVAMVVRALGYQPDVVGSYPAGYIAEAAQIPNQRGQDALLSGLSADSAGGAAGSLAEAAQIPNQRGRDALLGGVSAGAAHPGASAPLDRADVARLLVDALYATLPSTTVVQQVGGGQVRNAVAGPDTLLQRLGFGDTATLAVDGSRESHLDYPGEDQTAPPAAGRYSDVVVGTLGNNGALQPNQVQIGSLAESGGSSAPVSNTYTLAARVGLVGSTRVDNFTGTQVSYVTDGGGDVVFMALVTPAADVLAPSLLGTQVSVRDGVMEAYGSQSPTSLQQVALEPPGSTAFRNFDLALCSGVPCALPVPTSGSHTFDGSSGSYDQVVAILNPDGRIVCLIG